MALLCLLLKFLPPGALLHVVLALGHGPEHMADVVLAVDGHGVPGLSHLWISVVEPGHLILLELTPKKQNTKL